jgi:glycosyltransferase involved in cell wall biosynthesis
LALNFLAWARREQFDLIFSNTVMNVREAEALRGLGKPVVCRVAELPFWIDTVLGREEFLKTRDAYTHFIAVSESVRDALIARYGVPSARVTVIPGVVEDRVPLDEPAREQARKTARGILGLPAEAFVIGGCGTTDWRKGADLFVQVCRQAIKEANSLPSPIFIWAGGNKADPYFQQLLHDIRLSQIEGYCQLLGSTQDPGTFFAALDVFLLTSREDPFPLVVLEAAQAGVPCICFDGAGGAQDFVRSDAGVVIPYLDVEAATHAIIQLQADPSTRLLQGRTATMRVHESYTQARQMPRLKALLGGLIEASYAPSAQARISESATANTHFQKVLSP